jgi:hypothetical protein
MPSQDDYPFLLGEDAEESDFWAIPCSLSDYEKRKDAMKWLSSHQCNEWLIDLVMGDYVDISVLKALHNKGHSVDRIYLILLHFLFPLDFERYSNYDRNDDA